MASATVARFSGRVVSRSLRTIASGSSGVMRMPTPAAACWAATSKRCKSTKFATTHEYMKLVSESTPPSTALLLLFLLCVYVNTAQVYFGLLPIMCARVLCVYMRSCFVDCLFAFMLPPMEHAYIPGWVRWGW